MREAIQIMQKVFGLRTCENSVFSNRDRACLLGQIGRCSGAPAWAPSRRRTTRRTSSAPPPFSRGTRDIVEDYERRMWEASEAWAFEKAAFRDRIGALTTVQHQQAIETTGGDTDADVVAVGRRFGRRPPASTSRWSGAGAIWRPSVLPGSSA